jgi:hypothetical protein
MRNMGVEPTIKLLEVRRLIHTTTEEVEKTNDNIWTIYILKLFLKNSPYRGY